jgi:hypothetical protein
MSAMMARPGGRVPLEQSNIRLAFNMAKLGKGGCSRAAVQVTQSVFKITCTEVRAEKKRGVQFPGQIKVKAAKERHPAMIC